MVLTVHAPVLNAACYVILEGLVYTERRSARRDINLFISYSILVDTVEHTVFNPLETVLKDKEKKNSNEFKLITI